MNIDDEIIRLVNEKRGVFFSDISRELKISPYTTSDLVKRLENNGEVQVIDKGIAKLVVPK